MSDSETIYTSSDYSSDSESEGSMDGFIAPESTPEKVTTKRAEIDPINILRGKRKGVLRVSNAILADTDSDDSDFLKLNSLFFGHWLVVPPVFIRRIEFFQTPMVLAKALLIVGLVFFFGGARQILNSSDGHHFANLFVVGGRSVVVMRQQPRKLDAPMAHDLQVTIVHDGVHFLVPFFCSRSASKS